MQQRTCARWLILSHSNDRIKASALRVLTDAEEMKTCFARLVVIDPQRAEWQGRLSASTYTTLADLVRWFRIDVTVIEAKAKLSQNHTPERRQRVIEQLNASPDPLAQATGAAMARVLSGQQPWNANGT